MKPNKTFPSVHEPTHSLNRLVFECCDFKGWDLADYMLLLKAYLINSLRFPEAPPVQHF